MYIFLSGVQGVMEKQIQALQDPAESKANLSKGQNLMLQSFKR